MPAIYKQKINIQRYKYLVIITFHKYPKYSPFCCRRKNIYTEVVYGVLIPPLIDIKEMSYEKLKNILDKYPPSAPNAILEPGM